MSCDKSKYTLVHIFFFTPACYDPPRFDDAAIVDLAGKLLQNIVTYKCLPGYLQEGDASIFCQGNGLWSERHFLCRSEFLVFSNKYML